MNKYNARKAQEDGYTFDSLMEQRRYRELKLLQQAGLITGLEVHPRYPLIVNGVKVCVYEADFRYTQNGRQVVEDAKGVKTDVYKLKRKLMRAVHGIEIVETQA